MHTVFSVGFLLPETLRERGLDLRYGRPTLFVADVGGENDFLLATPIFGVYPRLHIFSEAGIFPIPRARHISMFDGVVMDVIEMLVKILFILNLMLPKSALPHRLLLLALACLPAKLILYCHRLG